MCFLHTRITAAGHGNRSQVVGFSSSIFFLKERAQDYFIYKLARTKAISSMWVIIQMFYY